MIHLQERGEFVKLFPDTYLFYARRKKHMSMTQTREKTSTQSNRQKLVFTRPRIRQIGNITTRTGQGGSSSQYDSYSDNRP
jgi:hypothetical protein